MHRAATISRIQPNRQGSIQPTGGVERQLQSLRQVGVIRLLRGSVAARQERRLVPGRRHPRDCAVGQLRIVEHPLQRGSTRRWSWWVRMRKVRRLEGGFEAASVIIAIAGLGGEQASWCDRQRQRGRGA